MSSSESVHSHKMDSRYSTPAPELDDHRRNLGVTPARPDDSPMVEIEVATPTPGSIEERDFSRVDKALLHTLEKESNPIARDFEQAIVDDDNDNEDGQEGVGRRPSIHGRRLTNREGRPRRHDRSRDSSSSRSTSPANSIEAFAEPRRRARANTAESHSSSVLENLRNRTQSGGTNQRRPTLDTISIPAALTLRTDRDANDDVTFPTDEEPGKTYKIDFEELEEFVALSAQGKVSEELAGSRSNENRTFRDHRQSPTHAPISALNGETFYEKPLVHYETTHSQATSSEERFAPKEQQLPPTSAERFFLFTSEISQGKSATRLGDFVSDGTTFRDLFDVGPDGGVWWLNCLNPTKAELEVLCKAFKIHRLTREDIETQEAREKVELFSQYYFVCFRSFVMDKSSEDFLDPIHIYIVVCGDGVLSFSYTENPHAKNVHRRISKLGDFLSLGPDYICYAMIDDIVDSFAPIIRDAEHESESIEDQVFIAREDDFLTLLRQIGECRKRVLNMMRLLGGKADVIKGFAKRCNDQYQVAPRGDIGLYLGDIQDHVVTMMSNLTHVEKMLSRSHANYLAQLNVDNILKGNHTNKALAKITVVATILVPLNLITGLFGMNVHVPGQDVAGYYWFFGIVGVICLFVATMVTIARKLKAI
ncbi:Magnesium transporter ALR1 [Exophiala dermatitidis]|uniref:MIT family metal ion transporter n=1 Tax=Exophiala dermatitidis (strain ATCC 34100 / CBS 525.76 / NIH/UT8656) TaxID=858893 RepID=H6BYW9_EXODN|nr:MIT family metal ion transporter [Exophiala dermatitidis NIH/UT8656]EHY56832.1 MIT family metal ion transporter [Exophiala dermatitidis NIH/UT8656]